LAIHCASLAFLGLRDINVWVCIASTVLLLVGRCWLHRWTDAPAAHSMGSNAWTCIIAATFQLATVELVFGQFLNVDSHWERTAPSSIMLQFLTFCCGALHASVAPGKWQNCVVLGAVCVGSVCHIINESETPGVSEAIALGLIGSMIGYDYGRRWNGSAAAYQLEIWSHKLLLRACRGAQSIASSKDMPPPPSPPPSAPSTLQLTVILHIISEVVNGTDEQDKALLFEVIETSGVTLRTGTQEAALRALVALADVNSCRGYAEEVSLKDAPIWRSSKFVERRQAARLPLYVEELHEFLRDATANYVAEEGVADPSGDDMVELVDVPAGDPQLPAGPAFSLRLSVADHPLVPDMLDALGMDCISRAGGIIGYFAPPEAMEQ